MKNIAKKPLALLIAMILIMTSMPMMFSSASVCDEAGHDFEWKTNGDFYCGVEGKRTQYCKVCGKRGVTELATMVNHSDANADKICDNCELNIVKTGDVNATMTKVNEYDIFAYCAAFIPEISGVYAINTTVFGAIINDNYETYIESLLMGGGTKAHLIAGESYIIIEADFALVESSSLGKVSISLISECDHINLTETNEVAPTCTEDGKTVSVYCNDCKGYIITSKTISALGHSISSYVEKDGTIVSKCARCDYTEFTDSEITTEITTRPDVTYPTTEYWPTEESSTTRPTTESTTRPDVTYPTTEYWPTEEPSTTRPTTETTTRPNVTYPTTEPTTEYWPTTAPTTTRPTTEGGCTNGHVSVRKQIVKATTKDNGYIVYVCDYCGEKFNKTVISRIDESSIRLSTSKCTYNGKTRTPSVYVEDINGKKLVEDVDYVVKYPSGRKKVGNYNINVEFINNYKGEKDLTFTIAPGSTDTYGVTIKENNVLISWYEVPEATGYRIYIYEDADSTVRKRVASVEGTKYTLTKDYNGKALVSGQEYKFAIAAYTKFEDGTVIHSLLDSEMVFEYDYVEEKVPEPPVKKECNCKCHKSGLTKLIFKIKLFVQRILGRNKVCDCGVAHY